MTSTGSNESSAALEEYKSLLTMRMLIYRTVSSALQSTSPEDIEPLKELFSRLPKDASTIIAETLGLKAFAEFYESVVSSRSSSLPQVLHPIINEEGPCRLSTFSIPVSDNARKVLGLMGIDVAVGETQYLNPVLAAEMLYSLLGMEYMALDEHNIMPLVKLETLLVEEYILPSFKKLAECLRESTSDKLVTGLADLLSEFADVEKRIASAQQRAIEEYEAGSSNGF